MDDIAPLRELAADGRSRARLFAPAAAIRARPQGFTGTPKPKDEPMAADPPYGAYIDYLIAGAPKGPVEISIATADGQLVRKFSSADPKPALDLSQIATAPEWIVLPDPPSARPGAHRFVWDLRYPKPAWLAADLRESGVWAPPGRYIVTLAVDGAVFRQPLEVQPDPRVAAKPKAYQRQFALARQIEADRDRGHAALHEADLARQGLAAAKAAAAPAGKAQLTALEEKVTIWSRSASPPGLEIIAERLARLAAAADGADGGPTPDAESGYAQARVALAASLAAWTALQDEIH